MKKTLFLLSLLAFSPAALAEVPSGYTEHVITDASQLEPCVNDDKSAFIIKSDVINSEHRMTGNHQYWGEPQIFQARALTFDRISGAPYGGAVRADDALTVEGLKGLRFTGNSAVTGGAVYGKGALTVTNNESVTFSGNTASLHGGAIDGASASISLTNNGALEFTGNSATLDGGAIASSGALCIAGNGSVTFRNNYEKDDNTYRLRSVFVTGGSLNLAAGDGQDITFYDTLYVKSGATVSFNNSYTDVNGSTQQATGDIVFSGKNAEHDLQALKATFTDRELENSLTTEVNATTNLYGGTLRIEDGAVYKGNGINLAENSGATLRLADGSLRQDGCNVSLAAGTTLALHGTNSITANSLDMQDGSTLSFVLGSGNAEKAALTLDGAFNQGGNLNIALQAGETFQVRDRLVLMTTASGTTPDSWDASKISLSGLESDRDRLSWENGVLYYNTRLTWSGENQVWDNRTESWMLGEYRYSNTDGMDVVFGDTGSGNVYLSGTLAPKSVLVENSKNHDYCFMRYGSLTGGMQLIKDGEGKLAIANTTNDYTGGTIIKGGTLQMGNENALGSGDVTLMGGTLDLGGHTLSNNVNVNGSGHIANGTVSGNLNLADNASFTWEEGSFLELTGSITLGNKTTLDLGKHTLPENVILNGYNTYIGNGSINHDLAVERGVLYLAGNIDGTGNIILGSGAWLRLAGYTLSNNVILKKYAVVGGGTLDSDLTVGEDQILTIEDDLKGKGNIILGDFSTLALATLSGTLSGTLSKSVILNGRAHILGYGTISGDLILADNTSFLWSSVFLDDGVQLTGNIALGKSTLLDLGSKTLSASVKLGKNSTITAYSGSSNTTIKTRESADSALLEKVSVSDGLIAGTDRQASLADGLYIQSEANLLIESMTITANNEIHVGEHTITLNLVTIDLSQAKYELVGTDYYFQLQDLINCKLEMDDVVFDASGLELPEGFDSGVNGIGMDFGTDVTIDPQTARNLTLLMGGDWSQTMSLVDGKPVFTALVPTPEPTTGVLSVLGLGLLAGRRRRR